MKTIETMYDLAELINNSEDYPLNAVEEAIRTNGWQEGESDIVCYDDHNSLVIAEDGECVVK